MCGTCHDAYAELDPPPPPAGDAELLSKPPGTGAHLPIDRELDPRVLLDPPLPALQRDVGLAAAHHRGAHDLRIVRPVEGALAAGVVEAARDDGGVDETAMRCGAGGGVCASTGARGRREDRRRNVTGKDWGGGGTEGGTAKRQGSRGSGWGQA